MSAITAVGLRKTYGTGDDQVEAVRGVDLDVAVGAGGHRDVAAGRRGIDAPGIAVLVVDGDGVVGSDIVAAGVRGGLDAGGNIAAERRITVDVDGAVAGDARGAGAGVDAAG